VVEGGIDLVGWAIRPREFVQDAIPSDCKVYVQRSALRSEVVPDFNGHFLFTNERLAVGVVNLRLLVEVLGTNSSDPYSPAGLAVRCGRLIFALESARTLTSENCAV
jgi:hypothetical protein